ncbi:MAG TPA: serine hydrolase [Chthoniobacteraceae bacterium]|nr:serine hydrolase [Chthoniobacteraceae bacterium]
MPVCAHAFSRRSKHLGSTFAALIFLQAADVRAVDEAGLRAAAEYSVGQRGTVLLVVRSGKKIFAETANGGSASTSYKIYSGTKMFWILAGLVAVEDGLLRLDEHVATTIEEWASDPQRSRVTIRQLLNFTSGLEPNFTLHGDDVRDRNTLAVRTRLGAAPGDEFMYGPAALQVFHEILKRKLAAHDETPTRFLERRVLRPLGFGPQRYRQDSVGNPLLASGFKMTANQWLKMGKCILDHGAPVVARATFAEAVRGTNANPAFGFALWNNHLAPGGRELDPEEMLDLKWQRQDWKSACLCRDAPSDLLACIGSGGQRLYVVPSQELIVVRQGGFGRFRDAEFLRRLFAR